MRQPSGISRSRPRETAGMRRERSPRRATCSVRSGVSRAPSRACTAVPAHGWQPRYRRGWPGIYESGYGGSSSVSAGDSAFTTMAAPPGRERGHRTVPQGVSGATGMARRATLRHAARARRRSRDLSMDFETALEKLPDARARSSCCTTSRATSAMRIGSCWSLGRHVEGAAAPRANDAARRQPAARASAPQRGLRMAHDAFADRLSDAVSTTRSVMKKDRSPD